MTVSPITGLTVKYYYSPIHLFFYIYADVIKDLCISANIQASLLTHA